MIFQKPHYRPQATIQQNHHISTSALKSRDMFPTQLVRSTIRTRILAPPRARQFSRNYGLLKEWKGSDSTDSSINRARKGDTNEPTSEATASGFKEREANSGIQDDTKQQGATERGGRKHAQKAKEEHPAAPEPIIGMNDERAGVRSRPLGFQVQIADPILSCRRVIDFEVLSIRSSYKDGAIFYKMGVMSGIVRAFPLVSHETVHKMQLRYRPTLNERIFKRC